ncbi:Single-stranded DNA-binding protein [compost metagenome]
MDINGNMQLLGGRPGAGGDDAPRAPREPQQQRPQQAQRPAPQQAPAPQPQQDYDSFDDDIPF